jgi:osmoprotectant transport system substrate-binding protein
MISLLLQQEGFKTDIKTNLNDLTLYEAMKRGDIDIYVEYTGTAYSEVLKYPAPDTYEPNEIYRQVVEGFEQEGIIVLYKIGFENAYVMAVTETWGETNNVSTISELVPYAPDLILGTDYVFHNRSDGLLNLEKIYNLSFKEIKSGAPTLMYTNIGSGNVDVISAYTTDTRIISFNLRTLEDDQNALPPYEAIVLARDSIAQNQTIMTTLSVLANAIDTKTMMRLNNEYDTDKKEAVDIAEDWLKSQGFLEK